MKTSIASFRFPACAAALMAVLLALPDAVRAAGTFTWNGATNGGWATAGNATQTTNWVGNVTLTSDNQTDVIFNTTTKTLATSGNGSYIGGSRTVRSLTYGAGINATISTAFNFFDTSNSNLTMSANTGNATITVDAGATGGINLGAASGVGTGAGTLILSSNLDVIHNGSGQLTFNRGVSGTGNLTKTGTGTLGFTGAAVANTYSGLTTVNGGALNVQKTDGTNAIAGNLLINGTGTFTYFAGNQTKDTSNVEVATGGTLAMSTFKDTVNGVKLSGGTITGGAGNTLTSTTAFDLQSGSASAILAGTAGATKTTSGTVTLSGVNTYTGVTTISAGTLLFSNPGSLYNSTTGSWTPSNIVVASGATLALKVGTGGTTDFGNSTTQTNFTTLLTNLAASTVSTGLQSGALLGIDTTNANFSTSAVIANTNSGANVIGLTKLGTNTLTLTGNNTYTGNTTISAGTLAVATNLIGSSPNIFIGNGATLTASSGFSMTSGQSITGTGATGTINGSLNPGLTMNGNNTVSNNAGGQLSLLRLSVYGANNTITAGDIQSGASGAGTSRGLNIGNGNAGTLTITGGSLTTTSNSSAVDILGSTTAGGVGTLIINGGSYTSAGGLNIGFGAGSGTLTLTSGNVTISALGFSAVNGNSDAIVNLNGGTFTLGSLTVQSGRANAVNFNGGTFVASATQTLGNGTGTVTLNVKNGGAIIDTNGNTVTISNSLVNFGGTSTGGLTKSGAGTLTLNAANTYAGATTISAGTLALGASGSIATSSGLNLGTSGSQGTLDITSQSSFTFGASQTVSGYGTVNIGTGKTVTINGNLAPGNSAGIMTVTGDLALANKVAIPTTGAITTMELGGNAGVAGTDYDQVVVSGQITFGGTLNIISLNSYNINQDATYHLFTGIRTGDFDFVTVAGTSLTDSSGVWTGTASSFDYTFTQSTGDLVISATVIPEPSTYAALVSLGILAFTVYRRRRSS